MARRSTYSKNRNYRGRKLFLFIAFVIVAGAAIWRLAFHVPVSGINNDGVNLSRSNVQQDEPAITTPEQLDNNASEPIETVRAVETHAEPAEKPDAETVSKEPEILVSADSNQAEGLFQQGRTALAGGDYITGRDKLSQAVELGLSPEQEKLARKMLNQAADAWLFSRNIFKNDQLCALYQVVSGDRLAGIGRKCNVPHQLLMRINNITKPENLQAGKNIKVVQGPFHVKVNLRRYLLSVYLGEVLVRSYPISIGQPGRETPIGLWVVKEDKKQVNPAWSDTDTGKYYYPNDPDNPLGERWIGLEGLEGDAKERIGFGIHGTIKPEEIGTAASRGCIRLLNKDVEELYDMLIEGKSHVRVVN